MHTGVHTYTHAQKRIEEKRREEKRREEKRRGEKGREGKRSEGKGREEKRRVMGGRGGTYQEDSALPRVAVPVANVRRNPLLSESDRRRFSPYVSILM